MALAGFEDVSYWHGRRRGRSTPSARSAPRADPATLGGDITKILLTIFGVGTMFFLLVTLTELFIAGDLSGVLDERRMQSKIAQLKDHYLICGFGRVGRQVAKDLQRAGVPFVVIDDNPDVREYIEEMDVLHVDGRGSDDEVMLEAGIERARAVLACVDSDAENIFATLTVARAAPRHPDRGAGGGRVLRAQADPRRGERGRLAVQGERAHDGEPRADRAR